MVQIETVLANAYLDISIGGLQIGRVVVELFDDVAPKASENFLHLCKGDKSNYKGDKLTFKGNHFHKVVKNFMIQAGDLTYGSTDFKSTDIGKGGCSIYSIEDNPTGLFKDENLGDFDQLFNLAMANTGSDTNTSQFFINTYPSPHLNNKHTIFGKVIHGKSTIHTIEAVLVDETSIPKQEIVIEDCGEWDESKGVPVYNASYSKLGGDTYEEFPDDDESFDKEKSAEAYVASNTIKKSATLLFKQKNYQEALFKYKKSLRYVVEFIPGIDQEPEYASKFDELKRKLYLNLSLTCVNLKDYRRAIGYSTYLLESETALNSEKAKSYYRRGLSKFELRKYDEALSDFKNCSNLNPEDKVVLKKIEDTEKKVEELKTKEKQKYAKFFG